MLCAPQRRAGVGFLRFHVLINDFLCYLPGSPGSAEPKRSRDWKRARSMRADAQGMEQKESICHARFFFRARWGFHGGTFGGAREGIQSRLAGAILKDLPGVAATRSGAADTEGGSSCTSVCCRVFGRNAGMTANGLGFLRALPGPARAARPGLRQEP